MQNYVIIFNELLALLRWIFFVFYFGTQLFLELNRFIPRTYITENGKNLYFVDYILILSLCFSLPEICAALLQQYIYKVQTGFHLYGLIYINWWRQCTAETRNDDYINYFLNPDCNNATDIVLTVFNPNIIDGTINITIITLNPNTLDALIMTYLVLDAAWIITAVALLMGAACHIKQRGALAFYVPWIVLNVLISLFDVFCAIFFGLHIPNIGTLADWLHFIGIDINESIQIQGEANLLVTGAASILMTFISSRGGFIWILNLVLIVCVVKAAKAAYRAKFSDETPQGSTHFFSASTRIRIWHDFYDSTEVNSPETNTLGKQNLVFQDETTEYELREIKVVQPPISNSEDLPSTSGFRNSAGLLKSNELMRKPYMSELRRQIPWTYLPESQNGDEESDLAQENSKNFETVSRF